MDILKLADALNEEEARTLHQIIGAKYGLHTSETMNIVRLVSVDAGLKINTIKTVRRVMEMGLYEAKCLVESLLEPGVHPIIAPNVHYARAIEIAREFHAVGATVEIERFHG